MNMERYTKTASLHKLWSDKFSKVLAMEDSSKREMVKRDADRIGALPDSILHYILSFLEMKEVVGTSLVSPRWRNLWVSVPVLNFDHSIWEKKNRLKKNNRFVKNNFMNFVDRVLFLHNGPNVIKFQISCYSYCDFDRFGGWMTIAARKQIREIHIDFDGYAPGAFESGELPDAIFCTGITVFKFNVESPSRRIRMPTSISLSPQLKTLVLSYIELPEGNSNGELVLSCPLLETLELVGCKIGHLSVLDISTLQLKNLVIYMSSLVETCQIKILTPILESLTLSGDWNNNVSLGSFSSLVNAKIVDFRWFSKAQYLTQFLESISCATTIELMFRFQDPDQDFSDMPTISFSNLRFLKLGGFYDFFPTTMLKVFESSPCLETLFLNVYDIKDWRDNLYYFNFHHLKSLAIGWFNCYEYEINFLKYLLENAVVLEKLMVRMGPYKGKFVERMENLIKASSSRVVLSMLR